MLRNDGYAISILEYEKKGKSTVPNLKDFYPNIKSSLCEFDKEKFPYKNETFDFVILFGVIEHIEPPTFHFWLEMNRVLKVGLKKLMSKRELGQNYLFLPNLSLYNSQ